MSKITRCSPLNCACAVCIMCCLFLRLRDYSTAHALSLPPCQRCGLQPWSARSHARRTLGVRKAGEMLRQEAASLSSSPRWTPSRRDAPCGRTLASASRPSTEGAMADRSSSSSSSPAPASAPGKAPAHLVTSPGGRCPRRPAGESSLARIPQSLMLGVVCVFNPNTGDYASRPAWATQFQTNQNTGEKVLTLNNRLIKT